MQAERNPFISFLVPQKRNETKKKGLAAIAQKLKKTECSR